MNKICSLNSASGISSVLMHKLDIHVKFHPFLIPLGYYLVIIMILRLSIMSRVQVFKNIFLFLLPFGFMYHPKTLIPMLHYPHINMELGWY